MSLRIFPPASQFFPDCFTGRAGLNDDSTLRFRHRRGIVHLPPAQGVSIHLEEKMVKQESNLTPSNSYGRVRKTTALFVFVFVLALSGIVHARG
jgi:hypothetical protein